MSDYEANLAMPDVAYLASDGTWDVDQCEGDFEYVKADLAAEREALILGALDDLRKWAFDNHLVPTGLAADVECAVILGKRARGDGNE